MLMGRALFARRELWAVGLLAVLILLYWKVRIIDIAQYDTPLFYSADMYNQHYPMTEYGFASLRAGRIPLWNPYQMCGEPFLATAPYVGLFYPLNASYLFLDVGLGTEVTLIIHMLLGAIGMWSLLRHFGVGRLGALCSAVTFVWSGWLIFNVNQQSLYDGMAWMPLTALLVDLVAVGSPWARLGLIVAVGCQVLQGGGEVFVHSMYAAAFFGVARLIQTAWQGRAVMALRYAVALVACVGVGVLLGAVQLLPTAELLRLSARAPGALSYEQISGGAITLLEFVRGSLEIPRFLQLVPIVTLGALPIVAAVLVLGYRKQRLLCMCALAVATVGLLLAFGGPLFRLYYASPIGRVFRRPIKFLDLYTFGQAVLAGAAISRLESWVTLPRRRLWLDPAWLGALGLGSAAVWWAATYLERPSPYVPGLLALMVLFGVLGSRWRRAALLGVCALQVAALFFVTGTRDVRPWQQPEVFRRYDRVLESLRQRAGYYRSYVYGLTPQNLKVVKWWIAGKRLRNRVFQTTEYEALVAGRYSTFFDYVAPRLQKTPFIGAYALGVSARWRLMDLTSTKYFLAYRGEPPDAFLRLSGSILRGPKFRLIWDGVIRGYEKEDGVLPRAYFAAGARVVSDPEQVLAQLDDPRFDPHREVILEEQPRTPVVATNATVSRADIVGYEAERVTLTVTTNAPGFLVLSDLFYPGWAAFVDELEVPIYRANYLFRAVQLEPGSWVVRFEYRPASFRLGIMTTTATALAITGAIAWRLWRRGLPW